MLWRKIKQEGYSKLDHQAYEATLNLKFLNEYSLSEKKNQYTIKSKEHQEHLCSNLLRPNYNK